METLNNMEKGTTFVAINLTTGKYISCKKTGKDKIYIYTYHDHEGRTLGGYSDGIESFLDNHELA